MRMLTSAARAGKLRRARILVRKTVGVLALTIASVEAAERKGGISSECAKTLEALLVDAKDRAKRLAKELMSRSRMSRRVPWTNSLARRARPVADVSLGIDVAVEEGVQAT